LFEDFDLTVLGRLPTKTIMNAIGFNHQLWNETKVAFAKPASLSQQRKSEDGVVDSSNI